MDRRVHLILLRHAQSSNNEAGADDSAAATDAGGLRQADPPLSDLGFAQSEAIACWVHHEFGDRLDCVFVSPMTRTLQTAGPLSQTLHPDTPFSLLAFAFECGGCFDGPRADAGRGGHPHVHGKSAAEIRRLIPAITLSPADFTPHGGWYKGGFEPEPESRARAERLRDWAWAQMPQAPPAEGEQPRAVLLVTHGFLMSYLLESLLGMQPSSGDVPSVSFLSANGCAWLLELRIRAPANNSSAESRSVGILGAGRTDHIPPPLRSGQRLAGFQIPPCME
ncbi:histidine phosphatase superfamily [Pavlovales sp. CCMP2436]|nr:histidine phosphatase superfamily [Pavlovales sp. CCMP2436]|mmetsp:Transcript_14773/g.37277  ORF Transcript_14773/g.37277 Transcript_14773/m.37277 type:complete len:279 (+) Transcript_14773:78-914(+)